MYGIPNTTIVAVTLEFWSLALTPYLFNGPCVKRGRYVDKKTGLVIEKDHLINLFNNLLLQGAYITPLYRGPEHVSKMFILEHIDNEFVEVIGIPPALQEKLYIPTEMFLGLYALA